MDVSKCREGRTDYTGPVSFIFIAILMSCLLVNETAGDAFIDALLPSFYSGIFMLGAILHSVSLFALLFPLFVVIAIINYRTFVYRPAKEAYDRRKNAVSQRQLNGNFASSEKQFRSYSPKNSTRNKARSSDNVSEYIVRVTELLINGILSGIINLSNRKLKEYLANRNAYKKSWCDMNMPSQNRERDERFDLTIDVQSWKGTGATSGSVHSNSKPRMTSTSSTTPFQIKRMMTSSKTFRVENNQHFNTSYLFGINEQQEQQVLLDTEDAPVVVKRQGTLSQESQPVIIFDTGEALLRIWSKLTAVAIQEIYESELRETEMAEKTRVVRDDQDEEEVEVILGLELE